MDTSGEDSPAPTSSNSVSSSTRARPRCSLLGGTTLEAAIDKLQLTAQQHVSKQIDVSTTDIDTAIKDAEAEIS